MDPCLPRPGARRLRSARGLRTGARRRSGSARLALALLALALLVVGPPIGATAATATAATSAAAGGVRLGPGGDPAAPTAATAPSPLGFRSPVDGPPVVVTPFAPPAVQYGPGHRGVDLAATAGTPIRAAGAGTVVFAGRVVDRPVVSIEHDGGLRTTYEPVEASVRRGARVAAGDVIGVLAAGHASCRGVDCLHWGARLPDRVYLDPLSLLGSWPVRLWPWEQS